MRTNEAKQKLLDAALLLFRKCGYTDTAVEDLCRAAAVTKGTFFHYFSSKEALALAAIQYWNEWTGALFASAPYQQVADPRDRILAYIDFRASLIEGDIPEWTCLLGTLVQETFLSHPALRDACGAGIESHTQTLVPTIEAAKRLYAPNAVWSAIGLGRHIQAVLQGAFVLAKANNNAQAALDAIEHLRQYIEQLIPIPKQETT